MTHEFTADDYSELFQAIRDNRADAVRSMLDDGMSPEFVLDGLTPLYDAAERGLSQMVLLLLKAGAEPNRRMKGPVGGISNLRTALNAAADFGCVDTVQVLLDAGANPCSLSDDLGTAGYLLLAGNRFAQGYRLKGLTHETYEQMCRVLETMFDRGLPINQRHKEGRTILHGAICEDAPAVVIEALLKRGADPACLDDRGFSPFHYTCARSSPEHFELFLKYGVDPHLPTGDGRRPLHLCGSQAIFNSIMTTTPDLEARDHDGRTALANSLEYWGVGIWTGRAVQLLAAGVSLDTPDYDGVTPRDIVEREKIREVIAFVAAQNAKRTISNVAHSTKAEPAI